MTTQGYEERLEAFAQGKRLRRFRGMIRNPKDPGCDACGSVMPSFLWGLRDMDADRDYFVGQSCLATISRMHLIERPFVRAGIKNAFERARGEAPNDDDTEPVMDGLPKSGHLEALAAPQLDATANRNSVDLRVYENDELVTVFVLMESASGQHQAWGAASAPRQPRLWQADGQLALGTSDHHDAALATCLRRAQRMAVRELQAATASDEAVDEAV